MNRIVFIGISCVFAFAACKKKQEPAPEAPAARTAVKVDEAVDAPPPPPTPAAPEAPAPDSPPAANETPQKIEPLTEQGLAMLNYAVYKFKEDTGRNPKSLQEMVGKTLPRIPVTHPSERLIYDPNTGQIKVEKVK
jgi:hypothetical protein